MAYACLLGWARVMLAVMTREEAVAFYSRYIAICNQHHFQRLGEFVAANVNAPAQDLTGYVAGLQEIIASFPDYHWRVDEILVDNDRLAVRLTGSGTHTAKTFRGIPATGRHVEIMELAMYHLHNGKIAAVWGDLGVSLRDALVAATC